MSDFKLVWESFYFYYSVENVQTYLEKCYKNANIEQAEQKSFQNCYPFIYYLEQGQVYYEQADTAPLSIKPILYFYGLVHLLKACILTADPNYPETTSVLAHGVSARKKKKQHYSFYHDEVKFQKSGLFPFMAEIMFHMKHLEGEKTTMETLLKQVPEMSSILQNLEGGSTFININFKNGIFSIPNNLLDYYHMTADRFIAFLKTKTHYSITNYQKTNSGIDFQINQLKIADYKPIRYNYSSQSFCFPIQKGKLIDYPELMIHYLLLYNLSMIARYETEWWSELIKMMANNDFPFIKSFLAITDYKGPYLVNQYLESKRNLPH